MIGVHFSVVEREEGGSKAIDWDDERNRGKRGCADRNERKRVKRERKAALAERERIRVQVRRFLVHLSNLEDHVMTDYLKSLPIVVTTLQQLIGDQNLEVCIDTFRQRLVTPGDAVDLTEWNTVARLQQLLVEFSLHGLYDDPVHAAPNATEAEQSSDSENHQ